MSQWHEHRGSLRHGFPFNGAWTHVRTKNSECSGVFFLCKGHYSDNWPNQSKTCGLDNSTVWISISWLLFIFGFLWSSKWTSLLLEHPCWSIRRGKRASCLRSILKWFREVRMHVRTRDYSVGERDRKERERGEKRRGWIWENGNSWGIWRREYENSCNSSVSLKLQT